MELLLVDGTSLFSYAYFGFRDYKEPSRVNGIAGFHNLLRQYYNKWKPKRIVVAFDSPPYRRSEWYPAYKANRPEKEQGYLEQLTTLKLGLDRSIPVARVDDWEADDCIASLVEPFSMILSSDKDVHQLVDETVDVYCPAKKRHYTYYNLPIVYEGLQPSQLVDFFALRGDTSDNIPGAKGIGPVKARQLLLEFGSLDNVYDNPEKVDPKTMTILYANLEAIRLSKKLFKLNRNLDIPAGDTFSMELFKQDIKEMINALGTPV